MSVVSRLVGQPVVGQVERLADDASQVPVTQRIDNSPPLFAGGHRAGQPGPTRTRRPTRSSVREAHDVAVEAEHALLHAVPKLTAALVHADPTPQPGAGDPHRTLAHHAA